MKKIATFLTLTFLGMNCSIHHADAQTCNPVALPYAENFNGAGFSIPALPPCTEAVDADGDTHTWKTDKYPGDPLRTGKSLYAQGQAATALADDWFYTEALELEKDSLYILRFSYTGLGATAAGAGAGAASFDVWWGHARHADSMRAHTVLFDTANLADNLNVLDTVYVYFKPARTATGYIGFHSKMQQAGDIYVDDILVEKAPANYVKDIVLSAFIGSADTLEMCPDSITVSVAIMNNGIETLNDIPLTIEAGGTAAFTLSVIRSGELLPGATDTFTFDKFYLSTPGNYRIAAYAALPEDDQRGNDTLTRAVFVIAQPVADGITVTPTGSLSYDFSADNPAHTNEFEWYFGDGNMGSGISVTHTYAADGDYTVTLIISNDCGSDTLTRQVDTRVNVPGYAKPEHKVQIYPNPARDMVMIQNNDGSLMECVIYNSVGAAVYKSGSIVSGHVITTGLWPAGFYLMQIRTEDGVAFRKFEILR